MMDLASLYRDGTKTVVTSHCRFSGCYPENTLTADRKAVEAGTDLIEFDVSGPGKGYLLSSTIRL